MALKGIIRLYLALKKNFLAIYNFSHFNIINKSSKRAEVLFIPLQPFPL